ncbi:MAG TPA: response regulator transcription factor, partial [Ktedonobacterales bacterium]|nr:response regulator transcription factor [Ktedonobacterales bacterium]
AATRIRLGEEAFTVAWAEGRTMSLEQVLVARETVPLPGPALITPSSTVVGPPPSRAELTPREMDVLHLLTQGLTNAKIAEHLIISELTVKSHVRSIYSKLGITSRSTVTRYAIEHRLV